MNPLQEAISEAASNHSVDSSLDEDEVDQAGDELDDPNIIDNLSDMVSANVSGRGTPNVSGRDTPSSQVHSSKTIVVSFSLRKDHNFTKCHMDNRLILRS